MTALLERLTRGRGKKRLSPELAALTAIDTKLAATKARIVGVEREQHGRKAALATLFAEQAALVRQKADGADPSERLEANANDRRLLDDRLLDGEVETRELQRDVVALTEQRRGAEGLCQEAALRVAALELHDAGRAAHLAFTTAAERLAIFIDADHKATQLASVCGEHAGRLVNDRALDAIAGYLMPLLLRFGTSFDLSITRSNRHISFIDAARRPFSPKDEVTHD